MNPPNELVGTLLKQSPAKLRFGAYQRRLVTIKDGVMSWSQEGGDERGRIEFGKNRVIVQQDPESGSKFSLRPAGSWNQEGCTFTGASDGRVFHFDTSGSQHNRETWMKLIETHVEYWSSTSDPVVFTPLAKQIQTLKTEADGQPFHVIVIVGPPASGKGTICDILRQRYGLIHICVGQVLSDHVHRGTALGEQVRKYVEKAELVPCNLVIDILNERLHSADILKRGCVLDNFPLTSEQARALKEKVLVDKFIHIDVPDEVLIERALERRVDPVTGTIYNLKFQPPPAEVLPRLVHRKDDTDGLMRARLQVHRKHVDSILPLFDFCRVLGSMPLKEVIDCIIGCMEQLEWTTEEKPYFGNIAFNGPFSASEAKRAGFFSYNDPPEVGDRVVCFHRGGDLHKRGVVVDFEVEVSNGSDGLRIGEEGVKVVVSFDRSEEVNGRWSAFLAGDNEMEYSSICTHEAFERSIFAQLNASCAKGISDVDTVSKIDARASLDAWLRHLEDADGEEVDISDDVHDVILAEFDKHADSALYLYSSHQKLTERMALNVGLDYSLYYRAVNNTLNSDAEGNLGRAMPLFQHMIHLLLHDEAGNRRYHEGGRVFKGDVQRPVPLNMHKLREAYELGQLVRFRQFQSTSVDEALADKYRKREDGRGYKWIIDIPQGFWGARSIQDIAWRENESETLFPAYSAFRVEDVAEDCCHLSAMDRSIGVGARAKRGGLNGTPVELVDVG